jgi:twinkle protein
MGLKSHGLPCPFGCGSSNGFAEYEDGGYCFVCKKKEKQEQTYTKEYVPWRGVSQNTYRFYNVLTRINADGEPVALEIPYGNSFLVRSLSEKKFHWENKPVQPGLFGKERFSAGGGIAITVTEGALDAMSCREMLGEYPFVSVRSASTARADCEQDKEYLDSFDKIYFCFDNDQPGREALRACSMLFDPSKVYTLNLTKYNDPNDYLTNKATKEFRNVWYNSKKYLPSSIISTYAEVAELLRQDDAEQLGTFPWTQLQEMTYGIRSGQRVLFTALEGIGKTEIVRAIEYHLLQTTGHNLGIIHLEESKQRAVKGLVGYHLQRPVHLPEMELDEGTILRYYQELTGRDKRVHLYNHFGSDDPKVFLDHIRNMVSVLGCRIITLDHISQIVSGLAEEDERKAIDVLCTRLDMLTEELGFALIYVSHVNDNGLTRGSRYISKIADTHIHLNRDKTNADPDLRDITYLTLYKNRFGSLTGPCGQLYFDRPSFMVRDTQPPKLPPTNLSA